MRDSGSLRPRWIWSTLADAASGTQFTRSVRCLGDTLGAMKPWVRRRGPIHAVCCTSLRPLIIPIRTCYMQYPDGCYSASIKSLISLFSSICHCPVNSSVLYRRHQGPLQSRPYSAETGCTSFILATPTGTTLFGEDPSDRAQDRPYAQPGVTAARSPSILNRAVGMQKLRRVIRVYHTPQMRRRTAPVRLCDRSCSSSALRASTPYPPYYIECGPESSAQPQKSITPICCDVSRR
ncbi:hypothetical protein C2E23DRAFT_330832 [Lenzites betulinus]|nr:hypothetical protein C2E23DRAFT_330832 [Lenzites betulinus]